jgi:hypothetical protein
MSYVRGISVLKDSGQVKGVRLPSSNVRRSLLRNGARLIAGTSGHRSLLAPKLQEILLLLISNKSSQQQTLGSEGFHYPAFTASTQQYLPFSPYSNRLLFICQARDLGSWFHESMQAKS